MRNDQLRNYVPILITCLGLSVGFAVPFLPSQAQAEEIDARELKETLLKTRDALLKIQKPDGDFVYIANLNPSVPPSTTYSFSRHGGVMYSLCQSQEDFPSPKTKAAIIQAAHYIERKIITSDRLSPGSLFVQALVPDTYSHLAASSLTLVGLLCTEKLFPGTVPSKYLSGLGQYLLQMQKKSGAFYSSFSYNAGPSDEHYSLYFPGEAALALLMLYRQDHSKKWLEAAIRGLNFLADSRNAKHAWESDNWAVVATAYLFDLRKHDPKIQFNQELLVAHAEQVMKTNLNDQLNDRSAPTFGGYDSKGRTTPTATHLEGLIAGIRLIPKAHADLRAQALSSIERGIRFLMSAQVKEGELLGSMPNVTTALQKPSSPDSTSVRMDYMQHALSAWLQYYRIITNLAAQP